MLARTRKRPGTTSGRWSLRWGCLASAILGRFDVADEREAGRMERAGLRLVPLRVNPCPRAWSAVDAAVLEVHRIGDAETAEVFSLDRQHARPDGIVDQDRGVRRAGVDDGRARMGEERTNQTDAEDERLHGGSFRRAWAG